MRLSTRQRNDNNRRAQLGAAVMAEWEKLTNAGDDPETLLTDLLADLMHWAKENCNEPFATTLARAEMHFDAERSGWD